MNEPGQTLSARAAASTCVVFTVIFVLLMTPMLRMARNDSGAGKGALAVLAASLLVLIWIWRFQITLADGTLTYTSLFTGTRSIKQHEIASVKTRIDFRARLGPVYQLVIAPQHAAVMEPIIINMKVFRWDDIRELLDLLEDNAEGEIRLEPMA